MLWCDEFCFVHYPKTAGKTLTRFFLQAWPRPIRGIVSRGQLDEVADCDLEGVSLTVGRGHENLTDSRELIREAGGNLAGMRAIFCAVRNPYDLMVSNYCFMRETFEHNRTRPNFIIAHENDFLGYCEKIGVASPARWMTLDRQTPANLRVIRFESMQADVERYAREFGFESPPLDHLNRSTRGHYRDYVCARAARAIEQRLAYYFDAGYYERETFDEVPARSVA